MLWALQLAVILPDALAAPDAVRPKAGNTVGSRHKPGHCSFYLLDVMELPVNVQGTPLLHEEACICEQANLKAALCAAGHTCNVSNFAADPSNGQIVYNPHSWADMTAAAAHTPQGEEGLYPWSAWPHWTAASAWPRCAMHVCTFLALQQ